MDNIKESKNSEPLFVRKHRWVLSSEHLSAHYQKNVKLDAYNQELTFESIMVLNEEYSGHNWAISMKEGKYKDEVLTLSHYNGSGEEIITRTFHGLKVIGHKYFFDYEDIEVAADTICVKFEKVVECMPIICPLTGIIHATQETASE